MVMQCARGRRHVVCKQQQSNMCTENERTEQVELCLNYDNILIDILVSIYNFMQVTNQCNNIVQLYQLVVYRGYPLPMLGYYNIW